MSVDGSRCGGGLRNSLMLSLVVVLLQLLLLHHSIINAMNLSINKMMKIRSATTSTTTRQQFIIQDIPYLHQITDYSCGDASLNMVLSYYYPQKIIDQRAIIDVARTSNHTGTLSLDVVRSARFSPLSSTPASQVYIQFPEQAPTSGWFNSKFANKSQASVPVNIFEHSGLATVYYPDRKWLIPCEVARNDTTTKCWVDHLVNEFLKNDIPVICLMNFKVDSGGHYRVAVGYEFEKDISSNKEVLTGIIMLDPWDRNNNPTMVTYGVDLFCKMWKHAEPNDDKTCFKPYFGIAAFPLSISVSENSKTNFNIKVTYPCVFPPSNKDRKQAENSPDLPLTTTIQHLTIEISALSKPNSNGQASIMFTENIPLTNTFTACDSHMLSYNLPNIGADSIRIIARGMVCDTVLPTEYNTNVWSPSYKYCDYVGGAIIHQL
ncbi:hypothetical protein C9374_007196 [Naegleria lovaniensis]|uniref:Peptidase C39-like domain-containing protein n=1 Tax=Naegleria lovaniensis TaxID=51637 RepID=A0AA88GZ82_NAELO|nr:uncharacterized protein C9374_007196 [Naegleria lovaniensis]KAG2393665.1 hypothetical protein C9374_007196 [Naegleria lovaniensis]